MRSERFLCIANSENGQEFLRESAALGIKTTLLTLDKLREVAWPRESLEELATMPSGLSREQIQNTVSWMARGHRYDRVIALDELSLMMVAELREHMRAPGMGVTTASFYRDRLAMRISARESGFPAPAFCRVLNYDDLREFMAEIPAPWLLRPREEGCGETRAIHDAEQLWRTLDDLGDRQSHYLLDQSIEGDLFHVDSILSQREVVFSVAHRSEWLEMEGAPAHSGYTSQTVERGSRDWQELTALNAGLAPSLGMVRGVAHADFIRSHEDGRFYFQQIAAPIAGVFLSELVEAATGVNSWREWARLEVAHLRGESYQPPESFEGYAGLLLWRTAEGMEKLNDLKMPEILARLNKPNRAGLLVRAADARQVEEILQQLTGKAERHDTPVPVA
jgi:hypothetical protein